MSDKIWFSDFLRRTGQYYYYVFPGTLVPREKYMKLRGALSQGREYDFSGLPDKMIDSTSKMLGSKNRKLKPAIAIDTFYVNDALCELLAAFELGRTRFHPVSFYDEEGVVKQHDGSYHMVLMQEPRETLDRALGSKERWIRERTGPSGITKAQLVQPLDDWPKHLVAGFTSDVDLWCDSVVGDALFFSDGLKRQLEARRYGNLFKFVECH